MSLQGPHRKLIHATLFEVIAIAITSTTLLLFTDKGGFDAGVLALALSLVALGWNMLFNTMFESWERRQADRRRTPKRRALHALGFELGLLVLTVPMIAWWLGLGWWEAFVADIALMLFFLVYGYVFNWAFDHVFGLPDSASA